METNKIEPIARLINEFSKLPGVGKKTAERYAYHIIKGKREDANEFANAIMDCKNKIMFCEVCGNFTDMDICDICKTRNSDIICVVKDPKDVIALEKARNFKCVYHVLHGTISPLDNRGPNDIRIKELIDRVGNGNVSEVILATNPDVEGEVTANYIAKLLKTLDIKVSRIAQGISMGSELEYADEVTLTKAIADRKQM